MAKIKLHRTLRVTERLLTEYPWNACADVTDNPLLPVTLSTDPEANIAVAIRLVEAGEGYRADWFASRSRLDDFGYSGGPELHPDGDFGDDDPYIVAQRLAAGVDTYLTDRGK